MSVGSAKEVQHLNWPASFALALVPPPFAHLQFGKKTVLHSPVLLGWVVWLRCTLPADMGRQVGVLKNTFTDPRTVTLCVIHVVLF